MKVLFDHSQPFALAHGGFQTQIEQTKVALEKIGIEVEHLRWWDDSQRGDIIHYFGRPTAEYIRLAHGKGMKVVLADLLSELGSRSFALRKLQKGLMTAAETVLPPAFTARLAWKSFREADACVAAAWEAQLMKEMFGAPADRLHVVPNGVEMEFLESKPSTRGPWLVCTATITGRKRVVELAEAAIRAQTPVWIVGKPYSESDGYAARFQKIAERNAALVRYEGPVKDRSALARIYREARGFVLLSTMESLSMSALEAAACECPLLLSDLPWAQMTFGAHASYCPVPASADRTGSVLRRFYDESPKLPIPPKPLTWVEVAGVLKSVYEGVL
jgi:glycosyltransferase involved in cell wall biosynthesis